MTTTARWLTGAAALLGVCLVVALGLAVRPAPTADLTGAQPSAQKHVDGATETQLTELRVRAALSACPPGSPEAPGPDPLHKVVLTCVADGASVNIGQSVAGAVTVLNLWAYWCGPCADELPAMAEYHARTGVRVLTVHQDHDQAAALQRLSELGVHLPTVQDGERRIAAALQVPNVMPATVVLRADGTVARILPRAFTSAEQIEAAVGQPT